MTSDARVLIRPHETHPHREVRPRPRPWLAAVHHKYDGSSLPAQGEQEADNTTQSGLLRWKSMARGVGTRATLPEGPTKMIFPFGIAYHTVVTFEQGEPCPCHKRAEDGASKHGRGF